MSAPGQGRVMPRRRTRPDFRPMPEPGSTDQWVQRVVLYDEVKDEIAALQPDTLNYLRRRGVPLYVRLDTVIYIAYIYRQVEGFTTMGFDPSVSFFRLSDRAVVDLQRTNFFANCIRFDQGGLINADGNESVAPGYWQISFTAGYVVNRADKLDFEENGDRNSALPDWSERGVDHPISLGNVYMQECDLIAILREHAPDLMNFPERLTDVGKGVRLMYRAAYELNVRKVLKEDVLQRLSEDGGDLFAVKRLDEASKFIRNSVRRTAGGSKDRPAGGSITLGHLDDWKEDCEEFLSQKFVSPGLRALLVASAWWGHYSQKPDSHFGPHVLKACLHGMGFSKTELPHLVSIIVEGTRWNDTPITHWLEIPVPTNKLAKYP